MVKKFIFLVVSSAVVFGLTIFFRLGGYKSVEVSVKSVPAMVLLYKEHEGPYNEIESSIEEVEVWARTHNLDCTRTFGEFFDDPRTSDERHLRSRVGCILPVKTEDAGPYKIEERHAGSYVFAEFDGAPSIGPLKVYPKLREYIESHHLNPAFAPLEIYTIKSDAVITEYLFGL